MLTLPDYLGVASCKPPNIESPGHLYRSANLPGIADSAYYVNVMYMCFCTLFWLISRGKFSNDKYICKWFLEVETNYMNLNVKLTISLQI